MRKNAIDNVEIVEPPIGELTKQRSGFKRACFTGCGCVVLLIILAIIGIRLFMGPGPQTVKNVPGNFPADIPVYDKDNIDSITVISGKYKNRGIEIAAFFPKVILSPLLISLNKDNNDSASTTAFAREAGTLKNLWKVITAPVGDNRDTVQIEWKSLNAEPGFVISYYKKELTKNGFQIDVESSGRGTKQFSFSRADGINGSLLAEGDAEKRPGTDYAILTVNLPNK